MKDNILEDRLAFKAFDKRKGTTSSIRNMLLEDKSTESTDVIQNIPIHLIDHLKTFEHPFEKSINIGIDELAEKIKISGVLEPVTLRSLGGRYELLAGHRRTEASKIAGITYIPAIVRECDDDTAKIIVTDTNLERREKILPSERAKAYKLQMEALKNQGKRTDLLNRIQQLKEEGNFGTSGPEVKTMAENNFGTNGPEVQYARDVVATMNDTSAKQISRYLRLNELFEPLLELVDHEELPFRAAVDISYLRPREQISLFEVLEGNKNIKISLATATELKVASKEMELSKLIIEATVNPTLEKEKDSESFIQKLQKPKYKYAIKNVEKYFKKIHGDRAIKLELMDEEELEQRIKNTVDEYLDSL